MGDIRTMRFCHPPAHAKERGFTFVWLLLALALLGLGSQRVFVSVAQEQRSAQLRLQARLVQTYNEALRAYQRASPGTQKVFPAELQDLLLDKRQLQTQRHLRKLYADPLQPGVDPALAWGLMRNSKGQITAVYALQGLRP